MNNNRFFIVGAAKCGTTSLFHYLSNNPYIYFPSVKEPHFYSNVTSKENKDFNNPVANKKYHTKIITSSEGYNNLYLGARQDQILGDASPSYLYDATSAKKIANDYPDARIIILIRDPIQRAFSHYLMDLTTENQLNDNFLVALKKDYESSTLSPVWGQKHLYVELGLYYDQIVRYMNAFDKEQIMVIVFEDFVQQTENYINEVFRFLHVPSIEINKQTAHNSFRKLKYTSLIKSIKASTYLRALWEKLPTGLKEIIKKRIYVTGEKPTLELEAIEYLANIFESDLKKLEAVLPQTNLQQLYTSINSIK